MAVVDALADFDVVIVAEDDEEDRRITLHKS